MKHEPARRFRYDNACAISQGGRDYQEDAIIADFSSGAEVGFVVLADGMGGHAAGDVASKIVVTEVFSELMFRRDDLASRARTCTDILRGAANAANACVNAHVASHPETEGMGATLVSAVVIDDKLHWLSIGDSPLYLYRDNRLIQLNEDHSLGAHIDLLVTRGVLSPEEGANHPERNVLTSVLVGETIAQIDCPAEPVGLQPGDTLIVASDGLQYLPNDKIAQILRERPFSKSAEIADALMEQVENLQDPDLDNVTFSVVQVRQNEARPSTPELTEDSPSEGIIRWPRRRPRTRIQRAATGEPDEPAPKVARNIE